MHILFLCSWYPTKGNPIRGIFFKEQALVLKSYGHKVGVIVEPHLRALRFTSEVIKEPAGRISYEIDSTIPTYRYCGWGWLPLRIHQAKIHRLFKAGKALFKQYVADHGMPDLIHAQSVIFGGIIASYLKKLYGISYVITEHSSIYERGLIVPWQIPLINNSLQNAEILLVVSPHLGKVIDSVIGKYDWVWVPNSVDSSFCPSKDMSPRAGSHGTFSFLNIALMQEHKGQADLLHAFAQQFKEDGTVYLRIGGDGPIRTELENLTSQLGIDNQVTFPGMLSRGDVLKEMQSTDALVLSSHYETFGVVLIEALACGKPVISTACGGPECIVHKYNGILVPPHDSVRLGQAMLQMRNEIQNYSSELIYQDSQSRFGAQAFVNKLTSIYHNVIHPHVGKLKLRVQ